MSVQTAESLRRVSLTVVSGQKQAQVDVEDPDMTVSEFISDVLPTLRLPHTEPSGRPIVWQARLARGGRRLNGSEVLVDVVETDDEVTLLPDIQAG